MQAPALFDERRAAQAAAYLLARAGGSLTLLGLIKLLYLSERLSLERYVEPLTGDLMVSMPQGPALSHTLDLANGFVDGHADGGWDAWMESRAGNTIALRDPAMITNGGRDLPALSRADCDVLDEVFNQWGSLAKKDPWALSRWCHTHCDEWDDPGFSSTPIRSVRLFRAVGYSPEQAFAADAQLRERAGLRRAFQD